MDENAFDSRFQKATAPATVTADSCGVQRVLPGRSWTCPSRVSLPRKPPVTAKRVVTERMVDAFNLCHVEMTAPPSPTTSKFVYEYITNTVSWIVTICGVRRC